MAILTKQERPLHLFLVQLLLQPLQLPLMTKPLHCRQEWQPFWEKTVPFLLATLPFLKKKVLRNPTGLSTEMESRWKPLRLHNLRQCGRYSSTIAVVVLPVIAVVPPIVQPFYTRS